MRNRDLDGVLRGLRDVEAIITGATQEYIVHRPEDLSFQKKNLAQEVRLGCGTLVVFQDCIDHRKETSASVK